MLHVYDGIAMTRAAALEELGSHEVLANSAAQGPRAQAFHRGEARRIRRLLGLS